MNYQFCVVGNGLIGAAVAFELSRYDESVCLIGATYGDEERFFSAHEDDSRMVRQYHGDPYWERLAWCNVAQLDALMNITGIQVFRKLPVFYRFPNGESLTSPLVKLRTAAVREDVAREFSYEDMLGGIIDPRLYIKALNSAAASNGAKILQAVVVKIVRQHGSFCVQMCRTSITARCIVDVRGFHHPNLSDHASVLGKIFILTESDIEGAPMPYCFIDGASAGPIFRNAYGFHQYRNVENRVVSKFGFSEVMPIRLQDDADVRDWFRGGYRGHHSLREAREWVGSFLGDDAAVTAIRPCAFTVTPSGRPHVEFEERLCTIIGCNGMAAKCCQALAGEVVTRVRGISE